jgi:hypothetical protein
MEETPVSQEGVPPGYEAVSLIEALNGPCGLPPLNTMEGELTNKYLIILLNVEVIQIIDKYNKEIYKQCIFFQYNKKIDEQCIFSILGHELLYFLYIDLAVA